MEKANKRTLKIAILMTTTLTISILGIAPAIPLIMEAYPSASQTTIQALANIPFLVNIPVSLFVVSKIRQIGEKLSLLIGIAGIGLGGILPGFISMNLAMLVACISLFGVGVGFLIPACARLITRNYFGAEQGDLMGKQTAMNNVGAMILSLIGGYLAVAGWQKAFYIYLVTIPIFVVAFIFVPRDAKNEKNGEAQRKIKIRFNSITLVSCLMIFVYGLFFGVFNSNNALLILDKGLGDSSIAGVAASMNLGVGIIGLVYGRIYAILKKNTLSISLLLVAIGILSIAIAQSTFIYYFGCILAGIGYSLAMSSGMFRASQSVDQDSASSAVTVYISCINIGLFLSPFLLNPLSNIFGEGTPLSRFYIGAIGLLLLTLFSFITTRKDQYSTSEVVDV